MELKLDLYKEWKKTKLSMPFMGKAYIWINDRFILLEAFNKMQLIYWNKIQSIDNKLNKFIIQKTDNTTQIIDLTEFEYTINMKIKEAIVDIAEEKNIIGIENDLPNGKKIIMPICR